MDFQTPLAVSMMQTINNRGLSILNHLAVNGEQEVFAYSPTLMEMLACALCKSVKPLGRCCVCKSVTKKVERLVFKSVKRFTILIDFHSCLRLTLQIECVWLLSEVGRQKKIIAHVFLATVFAA